jgi:hypothetical protein
MRTTDIISCATAQTRRCRYTSRKEPSFRTCPGNRTSSFRDVALREPPSNLTPEFARSHSKSATTIRSRGPELAKESPESLKKDVIIGCQAPAPAGRPDIWGIAGYFASFPGQFSWFDADTIREMLTFIVNSESGFPVFPRRLASRCVE